MVGLDHLNDYDHPTLKEARLTRIEERPGAQRFTFVKASLEDQAALRKLFEGYPVDGLIHLAAQAGVRYSLTHPHAYSYSNVKGFLNIFLGRSDT